MRMIHTPAMNRPKANPSSPRLQKPNEVLAGLHRLPGASNFERPSTKTTPIKRTVDTMPRSEAYERKDSGRKTVGIRLEGKKVEFVNFMVMLKWVTVTVDAV